MNHIIEKIKEGGGRQLLTLADCLNARATLSEIGGKEGVHGN